jgi:tRNA threonylcarbamoyladenosine biosynthesis protein TsaB
MFNLAIECSGVRASIALCYQEQVVMERALPSQRGTLETLAPTIASLVRGVSLSLISVTAGPGSFTGLRIGLATAKMLGMAWRIPIAGVDTLEVIGHRQRLGWEQRQSGAAIVVPGINAFRKQIFSAAWQWGPETSWRRVAESAVVDAAIWCDDPLRALDNPVLQQALQDTDWLTVSGPVLQLYRPQEKVVISPQKSVRLTLAPHNEWMPRAADVAALGWRAFQCGHSVTAAGLLPNYLRASAAEEKALRK